MVHQDPDLLTLFYSKQKSDWDNCEMLEILQNIKESKRRIKSFTGPVTTPTITVSTFLF